MTAIELRGLSKRFGRVRAVVDFSLHIERGELVALVGPSGCGKTTLLRMIAGFEHPDHGDVLFAGRSVTDRAPEHRRVGVVFQDYALFPHMSVARNIGYGLKFLSDVTAVQRRRRVDELLELVGLSGYGERAPHELSAGQQQRVAIARAVAPRPDVLLLDEPMSALDALLREELRGEIRRLQRELGITTLHVTHDQEEAIAVADRVAVMKDGGLEQVGNPREVYFQPETEFVAHFVGRGNLLNGVVAGTRPRSVRVRLGDGEEIEIAQEGRDFAEGQEVRVLVRPSRLGGDVRNQNRVHGEIAGVEFLGEFSRIRIRGNGNVIQAIVDSHDHWSMRLGETIELGFQSEDAWIIPEHGRRKE